MMGRYLYIAFYFTLFFQGSDIAGHPNFQYSRVAPPYFPPFFFLKRETVLMNSSLLLWALKIFRYGVYTLMTVPWELTLSYKSGSTPRREAKMKMAELLSLKVFRLP